MCVCLNTAVVVVEHSCIPNGEVVVVQHVHVSESECESAYIMGHFGFLSSKRQILYRCSFFSWCSR